MTTKSGTFGHACLAKKVAARYGADQDVVRAKMRYTKVVRAFLQKIEDAHQKAAKSDLKFGGGQVG